MARIVTKELAESVAKKLKAKPKGKGGAHQLYFVYYKDEVISTFNIRHGSQRDAGHNHIAGQLHISPREAKIMGQCGYDGEWYIKKMIEKKIIDDPNEKKPDDPANPPAS